MSTIYSLVKAGVAGRSGTWSVSRPRAGIAMLWHGTGRMMLVWRPEERVNQVVIWVRRYGFRPWEKVGLQQALWALEAPMTFIDGRLHEGIVEWVRHPEVERVG